MKAGSYRGFETELRDPGVLLITLNEPERKNGQTQGMKRDLAETFDQAQMDDAVRVVVITGSGGVFSAGDDITGRPRSYEDEQKLTPSIRPGHRDPAGTYAALRTISQRLNLAVRNLDKISIAAIDGYAIQTGLSLALACDFRIATPRAKLGSATLRWALQPDEGGHYLVVQLIGLAKALDFFLNNRIVDGKEALDLGLVHEVVAEEDLLARAMEMATAFAEGPQLAIRLLKKSLYNAAEMSLLSAFDDIASKTAVSDHHPDVREGLKAFAEKRKPEFNRPE